MQDYEYVPDFLDLNITQDTVETIAPHSSGYAGPVVLDSAKFKHMLLRHNLQNVLVALKILVSELLPVLKERYMVFENFLRSRLNCSCGVSC